MVLASAPQSKCCMLVRSRSGRAEEERGGVSGMSFACSRIRVCISCGWFVAKPQHNHKLLLLSMLHCFCTAVAHGVSVVYHL